MVRFQACEFFFQKCSDRLFNISFYFSMNSCSYFEIAFSVHFNQFILFYQTNWMHIKNTKQCSVFSVLHVSTLLCHLQGVLIPSYETSQNIMEYVGGRAQKNRIFFKKRRFIYISHKKHLIHFKILSIEGNHLSSLFSTVWSISGTAEAWDCRVPPAKLLSPPPRCRISFLSVFFFIVGNKKKTQGARSGE